MHRVQRKEFRDYDNGAFVQFLDVFVRCVRCTILAFKFVRNLFIFDAIKIFKICRLFSLQKSLTSNLILHWLMLKLVCQMKWVVYCGNGCFLIAISWYAKALIQSLVSHMFARIHFQVSHTVKTNSVARHLSEIWNMSFVVKCVNWSTNSKNLLKSNNAIRCMVIHPNVKSKQ